MRAIPWRPACSLIRYNHHAKMLIRLEIGGFKMTIVNRLCAFIAFSVVADCNVAQAADKPAVPLLSNGDFQSDADNDGVPDGWPSPKGGVTYALEGTNRFMRLASPKPDEMVITYRQVRIP